MMQWAKEELDQVGAAEEVQIASPGRDGAPRKPVTVWVVRHGSDLYARSVKGRNGPWFRGAQESHEGYVRAGGIQQDVTSVDADREIHDEGDAAYRAKYRRYAGRILDSVLTPEARSSTIKLVPRPERTYGSAYAWQVQPPLTVTCCFESSSQLSVPFTVPLKGALPDVTVSWAVPAKMWSAGPLVASGEM